MIFPSNTSIQINPSHNSMDDFDIILYDNSERNIFINGTQYQLSGTNALTALLVVIDQEEWSYTISDEYYEAFNSFLVTSIYGIENEGWDGWQYWVNYPTNDIPMVGANAYELSDGDIVSWFYGGYGFNPDNSEHVIDIEISIDTDETNPNATLNKPIQGGIYLNDNQLFSIPLITSSVIINSLTISIEATDEESGIDHISYSIDGEIKYTCFEKPYTWTFEPSSGIHKSLLTILVTDRCNQQTSLNQNIVTIN